MLARIQARRNKHSRSSSPTAMSSDEELEQQRARHNPYETSQFVLVPMPLRRNAWDEGNACEFDVRGATYLQDKQKVPSLPSVFQLLTCDLVHVDAPLLTGLCSHPNERIQTALREEQETGQKILPAFIYAVNLCVPAGTATYHWVAYFGIEDVSVLKDTDTPLGKLTEPFFFGGDDDFRNKTFKLIPRIVHGNVMVRKAVGSKPAVLGQKLKHYYTRTDRFLEMVVDIGSNKVAQRIVRCAIGCAKSLTVDMMFLLEGDSPETLPEQILGGVRLTDIDFKVKDGQRKVVPAP